LKLGELAKDEEGDLKTLAFLRQDLLLPLMQMVPLLTLV